MMDYYYGLETDADIYFTIPKLLFTHSFYKTMSCEAKVLYGLCLDRMRLSQRNGWMDEQNRVYIIYPIDRICDDLGCSNKTAVKWLSDLETYGLIEKKRLGRGKTSLLYVKKCSRVLTDEDRKKKTDSSGKKMQPSQKPALPSEPKKEPKKEQVVDTQAIRDAFASQIQYDDLANMENVNTQLVDKIMDVAVDMLLLPPDKSINIQGVSHTANDVSKKLCELKKEHILYVIESVTSSSKPVKNMIKYLQTSLYNALTSYDFHAANKAADTSRKTNSSKCAGRFKQFPQRSYDYSSMEKEFVNKLHKKYKESI